MYAFVVDGVVLERHSAAEPLPAVRSAWARLAIVAGLAGLRVAVLLDGRSFTFDPNPQRGHHAEHP